MGRIVLFAAVAVELVFAACCIHSRSYQATSQSTIRIGAFPLFVLLVVTSIVEWSLRWYAFAALLLIWALLGAIALVRKDHNGAAFIIGAVIKKAILAILAVLLALSQAAGSDPDPVYALIDTTKIGVENGQFVWDEDTHPIPVLSIYSDSSWSRLDELPQYAANAKLLADTKAISYNVHMQGAGHLSLTDLAFTSPLLTRILNGRKTGIDTDYCLTTISRLALEFFDCYPKGKRTFVPQASY